jgi:hypothetical protein
LGTLTEFFSDKQSLQKYVDSHRSALQIAHKKICSELGAVGLRHTTGEAGLFVLIDLRDFASTYAEERLLWLQLLDTQKINLTPGTWCVVYKMPQTIPPTPTPPPFSTRAQKKISAMV